VRGFKKTGAQAIGRSKGGLTCKIHMMAMDARRAVGFILSGGQCHDAPHGRLLMETVGPLEEAVPLVMDRAYEDGRTRRTAWSLRFSPVVPPKSNRVNPWGYDAELYRKRNEIERLFRLMQGFRRIFCRFEKLDAMYIGFIQLALVYLSIK